MIQAYREAAHSSRAPSRTCCRSPPSMPSPHAASLAKVSYAGAGNVVFASGLSWDALALGARSAGCSLTPSLSSYLFRSPQVLGTSVATSLAAWSASASATTIFAMHRQAQTHAPSACKWPLRPSVGWPGRCEDRGIGGWVGASSAVESDLCECVKHCGATGVLGNV